MAIATSEPRVGPLLREWRRRRRLSQLELALDAGISARHLSFVETGRSTPSAEVVLLLADELKIPFRERNRLLLAAGHAPAFPERPLGDPSLTPIREALELVLAEHDPYPAFAVDRHWNVVAANKGAGLLTQFLDPKLLEPPVNAYRVGLHPRGMAAWILNIAEVRANFVERLRRQVETTRDDELAALLEEVEAYASPESEQDVTPEPGSGDVVGPVRVRAPGGGELTFFGMFATFDFPFEVTTSELALELIFPGDAATAAAFRQVARTAAI